MPYNTATVEVSGAFDSDGDSTVTFQVIASVALTIDGQQVTGFTPVSTNGRGRAVFTLPRQGSVPASTPNWVYTLVATETRGTVVRTFREFSAVAPDCGYMEARVSVSATTDTATPAPLGLLRAALNQSRYASVRIAYLGSSTLAGEQATLPERRVASILTRAIQAGYPSGGAEALTQYSTSADFTLSSAPGVQGFSAAEGGTTSANYLTGAEQTKIITLNPRVIVHMIGANDWSSLVPVATFKAQVAAVVDALETGITGPLVQVLVHSYPKIDGTVGVAPWAQYGQALAEIAAERPSGVLFIDLAPAYAAVGIPGTDPLNLINGDNVHQGDAGHAFMADLLREKLGIAAPATAPSPATSAVYTSDAFSVAEAIWATASTDAGLAGTAKVLESSTSPSQFTKSGGRLVRGGTGASQFVGLPMPTPNQGLSIRLFALPSGSGTAALNLFIRRAALATSVAYRVNITNVLAELQEVDGSGVGTSMGISTPIVAGDVIDILAFGTKLSLYKNFALVGEADDATVAAAGYAGLSVGTTTASFSVEEIIWKILV